MTNILSAISGQFSKSWILGAFFPAVLFTAMSYIFLRPLFPADLAFLTPIEGLDSQWQALVALFITIVLSGVLYNLNIPIIRFYEGYPWKDTRAGEWRTKHYQRKFVYADVRRNGMRVLRKVLRSRDKQSYTKILKEWNSLRESLNSEFPRREGAVLPTRLGNVIRSFESYAYRQYRMDDILLWPRLIGKIDSNYAAGIDSAKTAFDFTLNCSLLSNVLALALLIVGLFYRVPFTSPQLAASWLLQIAIFLLLAYLSYIWSLGRASAWGGVVKGAYDLYRWDLLKQMGYTRVPQTLVEERLLWDDITLQLLYGDEPDVRLAEYNLAPPFARGTPYVVNLSIGRGVTSCVNPSTLKVTLQVQNMDEKRRAVEKVQVTDKLPDGFVYQWDSARCCERLVPVTGANPYYFEVGDLQYGEVVMLTYHAIQIQT